MAVLSLSVITLRSGGNDGARQIARANARLALNIAVGELQKHAGPDQRVTGSASLGTDSAAGNLIAVWNTDEEEDQEGHLLVSGNEDGEMTLESVRDFALVSDPDREVLVKRVDVTGENGVEGRYGWWVSDEGVKARIDLETSEEEPETDTERYTRARVPQETGVETAVTELADLSEQVEDKRLLASLETLAIASDSDVPTKYIHDITTGGAGLPVNVAEGGMKTDLSLVFDSSQDGSSMVEELLGAQASGVGGSRGSAPSYYDFSVSEPERFYFAADQLSDGSSLPVGPNMGILYNYAKLWENVSRETTDLVELSPVLETDIRSNEWPPYADSDEGSNSRDNQHTNSPVQPVLSLLQMGFRMRSKGGQTYGEGRAARNDGFQLQLEMKPVIGLWNPYNVKLSAKEYQIDWALYPFFRLGALDPDGTRFVRRVWMRENWLSTNSSGSSWFRLRTPSIDLEPGEIRYFSVTSKNDLGRTNELVAGWNEDGGFVFDLRHSTFDGNNNGTVAGEPMIFPPGTVVWYGDLYLEDAQHEDTAVHFASDALSNLLTPGNSASWITLKGDNAIHRVSDIWQTSTIGQTDEGTWKVPEQVLSRADTGSSTQAERRPIEELDAVPYHVGTWAWYARTSTEATQSQSTRGWADANVRYGAANPLWDGSVVEQGGSRRDPSAEYTGWYFNSPMLGASWGNPDEPFSETVDYGDGGPGGRGKVAEASLGDQEPQAAGRTRYRGFGGPSSTATSGQNYVALFDVPRAPMVSLGQFQHAQLSRYNFEPTFAFGNSYASSRIPLEETVVQDFAEVEDFNMLDLSYVVNEELWDNYFFSTMGKDYLEGARSSLDDVFPFDSLTSGELPLSNPRYRFRALGGDTSLEDIVEEDESAAPREFAGRIMIEGAFNVNSTSKTAWKATLSSLGDLELPVITTGGTTVSWEESTGINFPRFGHVLTSDGWTPEDSASDASFWNGFRSLSDTELDELAEAIAEEVQERGPFRSFADFVNRDPNSSNVEHQRKGALQAAIDRTVNSSLTETVGGAATKPDGDLFSNAVDGENESAGNPGYLLQGDVLQSLAPVLSVRSDYFRIRTVGEALDPSGNVIARAYAEAFVQRVPDYLDSADKVSVLPDDLTSEVNRRFGRRFQITSFRWLNEQEI